MALQTFLNRLVPLVLPLPPCHRLAIPSPPWSSKGPPRHPPGNDRLGINFWSRRRKRVLWIVCQPLTRPSIRMDDSPPRQITIPIQGFLLNSLFAPQTTSISWISICCDALGQHSTKFCHLSGYLMLTERELSLGFFASVSGGWTAIRDAICQCEREVTDAHATSIGERERRDKISLFSLEQFNLTPT